MSNESYLVSDAVISRDGTYRYVLIRRWDLALPVMPWVCLNPSTADWTADDPSVRRMNGFARRQGCGGIAVLNLYALRSASPAALAAHPDPAGPDNDAWLAGLVPYQAVPVMAAWGAHPAARRRVPRVLELLAGTRITCLGLTGDGSPRHPLYVRGDAEIIPYGPDGAGPAGA